MVKFGGQKHQPHWKRSEREKRKMGKKKKSLLIVKLGGAKKRK